MRSNQKIQTLESLAKIVAQLRTEGKTITLTHGQFDLLHVGVIRQLEESRGTGDILIVSVAADPHLDARRDWSLFSQQSRAEAMASLHCTDFVIAPDSISARILLETLRPQIYVPWEERGASDQQFAAARREELEALEAYGGKTFSVTNPWSRGATLRHHLSPALPPQASEFLDSLRSRYSADTVADALSQTRDLRVLFIGETIIDEYQYCETLGKSGKEPVLAVRYSSEEQFAGGILATSNQAASICDRVSMLTQLGTNDSREDFIRARLQPNLDAQFLLVPGMRTIVKRRFVEMYPFQKLFEVYFMDVDLPEIASIDLRTRLEEILPNYDAVVVTDYGHGMLTPDIIELLAGSNRFLAVNTQANAANQGFNTISKYPRANFVCLSEKELRLEARNRSTDVRKIIEDTSKKMSCRKLLITRGKEGCLCYQAGAGFFRVPPFTNRIVDRVGAGDALLAVTSLCAARDVPMELVGFIGNAVGSLAVETVGNRAVVSREALHKQIDSLLNYDQWITMQ